MARHHTEQAAKELLISIKDYWEKRGFLVEGEIVPTGYSDRLRATVFEVRTDMVGGRPVTRIQDSIVARNA